MVQAALSKSRVKPAAPASGKTAPTEKGSDETAAHNHEENAEEECPEDDQELDDEVC